MQRDKQNTGAFENGLFEDDHIACLFELVSALLTEKLPQLLYLPPCPDGGRFCIYAHLH